MWRGLVLTGVLALSACTAPAAAPPSSTERRERDPAGVIVHLLQWPWADVARECTQEHVTLPERGFPWWQDYQPTGYQIRSRRGDRAAFAAMVEQCHSAGVKIYASNYQDRAEVQTCDLVGLPDLATEKTEVRQQLAAYLNDLPALGVDGFRIDAAKHMAAQDIRAIVAMLTKPALIYSEVLYSPAEPIQILNMVRWRSQMGAAPLAHWWAAENELGFAREGKGYFALNRAGTPVTKTVETGLTPGRYRDVMAGSTVDIGVWRKGRPHDPRHRCRGTHEGVTVNDWWRDAVVYQVYPRSFADGNGDGIGDLIGARHKLPYLAKLGVDAIWLSPFYTSPLADGGYDVADYRHVDPRFGTLADFDALMTDAHALGIRVIVDIVPNHSSSEHPWFQEALAGKHRDRYIFRDEPNDWESVFGGPAWTQTPDGQWYLHLFDPTQPDFNWENPKVRAEFRDILRFWLDRGVDGFRIDVAHGMIKADGLPAVGTKDGRQVELLGREPLPYFDQDGVHEIYREWRPILDSYGAIGVAEAWVDSPQRLARYIGRDELHQAFNFDFMMADFNAKSFRTIIDKSLAEAELVGAPTTWVLSNHDKLRHVTRYGSLARAKAATLLMLALPGSAYLYNGEELGLDEVLDLPDELREDPAFLRTGESRDGCRVPIPWGAGAQAWVNPWLPQPAHWSSLTAESQEDDPASTLNFYRAALKLRRGFSDGLEWLEAPDDVLHFHRGSYHVLVNISDQHVPLPGDLLLSSSPLAEDGTLPPDTTVWVTA